jgi:hypothetical protein
MGYDIAFQHHTSSLHTPLNLQQEPLWFLHIRAHCEGCVSDLLTYFKRIPLSLLSMLAHIRNNCTLVGPSIPQADPVTPSNPISRPVCPRIDSDDDDDANNANENLFAPDDLRPSYPTTTAPLPQPSFNFQQPQPFILKPAIFTNTQA